jgi:hypothetical protein
MKRDLSRRGSIQQLRLSLLKYSISARVQRKRSGPLISHCGCGCGGLCRCRCRASPWAHPCTKRMPLSRMQPTNRPTSTDSSAAPVGTMPSAVNARPDMSVNRNVKCVSLHTRTAQRPAVRKEQMMSPDRPTDGRTDRPSARRGTHISRKLLRM